MYHPPLPLNSLIIFNFQQNFKEAYSYRIKYESLLLTALQNVVKTVTQIVNTATSQIVNMDNKSLLNLDAKTSPNVDSAFSFYYGKFQNAANKVSLIMHHIEAKIEDHEA